MTHRTVNVRSNQQDVTSLNQAGDEYLLGKISIETYGQGEVRRIIFKPSETNPWATASKHEQGYVLGTGSSHLSFINPADVQRPFFELGYELTDQIAWKGGLQMRTFFKNPERETSDLFTHDHAFWAQTFRQTEETSQSVFEGIKVDTNLILGRMAASVARGLWRSICSNGLIASVLGLPSFNLRHTDWAEDRLENELASLKLDEALPLDLFQKGLINYSDLQAVMHLSTRFIDELNQEGGLSHPMKALEGYLTSFSPNRLKTPILKGYLQQLQLLANTYPEQPVSAGALVNAYTNAVNEDRVHRSSDRGAWTALDRMDSVLQTTVSLAQISSIFSAN